MLLCAIAAGLLVVYNYGARSAAFRELVLPRLPDDITPAARGLAAFVTWHACTFVVLGVLPVVLGRLVLGWRPADMGLRLPQRWREIGLASVLYAAFVPVLIVASRTSSFQETYPLLDALESAPRLVGWYEVSYFVYWIGWEFFFRGFLLFGLERRFGDHAVLLAAIPFVIMHFGKPVLESIGAFGGACVLGLVALRTRSMLAGVLLHFGVALTMDLLALGA